MSSNSKKQTQNKFPPDKGVRGLNCGFTLIELLVTMSIIAILFAVGMPAFSDFQKTSRLKESAETLETAFGEAFSSARSRPECFVFSGSGNSLKLESFDKTCEGNAKNSREISLNPGVEISENFKIKFKPPFGDLELVEGDLEDESDELKIKLCNKDCVNFVVYQKSGLLTRKSREISGESVSKSGLKVLSFVSSPDLEKHSGNSNHSRQ